MRKRGSAAGAAATLLGVVSFGASFFFGGRRFGDDGTECVEGELRGCVFIGFETRGRGLFVEDR
ncbi:MAG: hypothetical protein GWN87_09050, partial [Desulfuromonadales bacterium]|nr:hypothetical protein [Desulfuromonadales bacterium]